MQAIGGPLQTAVRLRRSRDEPDQNRLPAPVEGRQRAPTLMASADAGGQGQVMV